MQNINADSYIPHAITFFAGASYGFTTVIVGQPLDTIKTRMQGLASSNSNKMLRVASDLFQKEGIRGLYRGGLPLFVGGSLMRSAQFGVSAEAKTFLSRYPSYKIGGILDYQVLLAGLAGGVGRALVEIPTDFFKIRRQVEQQLSWHAIRSQLLDGTGITIGRNSLLFMSFMIFIDLSKQSCQAGFVPSLLMTPEQDNLSPFAKGAICANLAWLTVWPFDVIKTQRQSGLYTGQSAATLFRNMVKSGQMFRGVVPGLIRSTISNGTSMAVYEMVHNYLSKEMGVARNDMT